LRSFTIAAFDWRPVFFPVAIRIGARVPAAPFRLNSALDASLRNGEYRVELKRLPHRMRCGCRNRNRPAHTGKILIAEALDRL
jgi:hypothetical protein